MFDYYSKTASKKVAHKIRRQILSSTKRLNKNPKMGQMEFYLEKLKENHRYILSGNYKVIYKIDNSKIIITDVFDVRQNPDKINDTSRKTEWKSLRIIEWGGSAIKWRNDPSQFCWAESKCHRILRLKFIPSFYRRAQDKPGGSSRCKFWTSYIRRFNNETHRL